MTQPTHIYELGQFRYFLRFHVKVVAYTKMSPNANMSLGYIHEKNTCFLTLIFFPALLFFTPYRANFLGKKQNIFLEKQHFPFTNIIILISKFLLDPRQKNPTPHTQTLEPEQYVSVIDF